MDILINDANILIDLVHLDLMNVFIQLEVELKTTDFVYEELNNEQKALIQNFVETGSIEIIVTTEGEDFDRIAEILANSKGLSFEDCSVWHYAEKLNGILLSGDGRLRNQATASGISVRGILYIFDQLLLNGLLTFDLAIQKIEQLYELNPRLPLNAKSDRLASWNSNMHVS